MWLLSLLACNGQDPAASDPTPCVSDVPAAFAALPTQARTALLTPGSAFGHDPVAYQAVPDNDLGIDNHWQGIARAGPYLYVSGGDRADVRSDVMMADERRILAPLPLGTDDEWHAGGLGQLDGVLAIPTETLSEQPRSSSIRFVDVAHPLAPRTLGVLDRGLDSIAHAAGLARWDDGLLLASWDDTTLELYTGQDFDFEPLATLAADDAILDTREVGTPGVHGQAVSLVSQCDGTLYALFTDNTSDLPIDTGVNFIDLFELDPDAPSLRKVASRALSCPPDQGCNFRAAAGVHVTSDARLEVLSVPLFRRPDGTLPLAIFGLE